MSSNSNNSLLDKNQKIMHLKMKNNLLIKHYKEEFYEQEQGYLRVIFAKIQIAFIICFGIKFVLLWPQGGELREKLYFLILCISSLLFFILEMINSKWIKVLTIIAPILITILKFDLHNCQQQQCEQLTFQISTISYIIYIILHFIIIKNSVIKHVVIFACFGYFLGRHTIAQQIDIYQIYDIIYVIVFFGIFSYTTQTKELHSLMNFGRCQNEMKKGKIWKHIILQVFPGITTLLIMNQNSQIKQNCPIIVKNSEKQQKKKGLFFNLCSVYEQIKNNLQKKKKIIEGDNLINNYQHPWNIKDISKEGNEIYKINDQKDLEIYSEKILVDNSLCCEDKGMTLRDVLNEYFRQSSSFSVKGKNEIQNAEIQIRNSSDLNLLKVEKFVGVNSFNQEKYNISICKFIQNDETQILLKIDNVSLKEKVEQLEQWDHQKDQVLFNITHDLKTPLNAIMHMIQEAKEQKNVLERNDTLSFAYCNSEMLLSLIHDILDFAQLKENKLKIIVQQINILEIVESVLQIMRVQTQLKEISLNLNNLISQEDEIIATDPRRIKQILINLISNAIKFTTTGFIELIISKIHNYYKFEVIDTGTGIQPAIITKLCQPFQTFGNEKYKNSTGVGLGLCFCKQLVGLLGPFEDLFIDSVYGKGSKFGFIIEDKSEIKSLSPLKDQLPKNIKDYFSGYNVNCQQPDIEEFNYSIEKPHRQFVNYLGHTQTSYEFIDKQLCLNQIKEDQSFEITQLNVLIVDDCLFNIIVLKSQLSKLKEFEFKITQAYNGEMAVNQFKQFNQCATKNGNLNIIFMDCNMPIMDGYKATEQIKMLITKESFVGVVVVALSAQILDQQLFHFDYILSKPCSIVELQRVLHDIQQKK